MLPILSPIYNCLEETYEAVRIAIDLGGSDILGWSPSPNAPTFAWIVEHIASGNLSYSTMIGPANVRRTWEFDTAPSVDWLLERLEESLITSKATIAGVTEENLHISRSDSWTPNCEEQEIRGPLDALWFTLQMARHTAYHLGQLNTYLRIYPTAASS